MQIEINSEHKLVLVHFKPEQVEGGYLEKLYFKLSNYLKGYEVIMVPYGEPAKQGNSVTAYICTDDEVTMSAVMKIIDNPHKGRIVPLTDAEFKAITSKDHFRSID